MKFCWGLGLLLQVVGLWAYVDDATDYRNYKVVHVVPQTAIQLQLLQDLETHSSVEMKLDFWNHPQRVGDAVNIGVPADRLESLISVLRIRGVPNSITVHDMQAYIDQERRENPPQFFRSARAFAVDQYHQLSEITTYIKQLAQENPSLVRVYLLGHTHENREINGVRIGINSNANKPIFYIDAGIHAREWVAPATALYIINDLVTKQSTNATIKALLTKYDFFIIPVVNADGYSYTWTNNRNWRKNRSRPQPLSGCYGVDPNRNFPVGFGGASTSSDPCSDLYRGINAFSESEARAIQKYTQANATQIRVAITLHSFGQMWMCPWGYVSQRPTDYTTMVKGANTAVAALRRLYGTSYRVGSIYEVIYPAGGGSIDWQYQVTKNPYTYAVELRDTGMYGFMLPRQFILPTATETWAGMIALANSI